MLVSILPEFASFYPLIHSMRQLKIWVMGLGLWVAYGTYQSVLGGLWEKQHEHGFEIRGEKFIFWNLWTGKKVCVLI